MTAAALTLLLLYAALAAAMSVWANRRFSARARLPMQWWLNGQPTWYAPRRLALVLFPLIGGIGLIAGTVGMIFAPHRLNVPMHKALDVLAGTGLLGIAIYAGYLGAVWRWDRTAAE